MVKKKVAAQVSFVLTLKMVSNSFAGQIAGGESGSYEEPVVIPPCPDMLLACRIISIRYQILVSRKPSHCAEGKTTVKALPDPGPLCAERFLLHLCPQRSICRRQYSFASRQHGSEFCSRDKKSTGAHCREHGRCLSRVDPNLILPLPISPTPTRRRRSHPPTTIWTSRVAHLKLFPSLHSSNLRFHFSAAVLLGVRIRKGGRPR